MRVKTELWCEKHQTKYWGLDFGFLKEECAICQNEREERIAEMASQRAKEQKRAKLEEKERYLSAFSGLTAHQLKLQAQPNVGAFSKYCFKASCVNSNLIISGGTGSGKTLFCIELIKANYERAPFYVDCNDLAFINPQRDGWRIDRLTASLDGKGIVVFDEAQVLISEANAAAFEVLINAAYKNGSNIVIAGNLNESHFNLLKTEAFARSASRIKANIDKSGFLDFGDMDLR